MIQSTNLSECIYKNAEMGMTSLKQIIPGVKNHKMKNILVKQYSGYCRQMSDSAKQLKSEHITPIPSPLATKVMAKTGIALTMLRDNSTESVAKMLVRGTNSGIIELNSAINHTKTSSPEIIQSAKNYLEKEQQYLDSLKKFL
ncbi:MAG: hypothetical protein ACI4SF_16075 [Oscillospiraceae bacterium]